MRRIGHLNQISHSTLLSMKVKQLKQLVLEVFGMDSMEELKQTVPAARECDFRKKWDIVKFYVIHSEYVVVED